MRQSLKIFVFFLLLVVFPAFPSFGQGEFVMYNTTNSDISSNRLRCCLSDSRGYLWIGTEIGLNRFDGAHMKAYNMEDYHLHSKYIFCITEDNIGNIWIGTSRGISYYDYHKDIFIKPSLEDGSYIEDLVCSIAVNSAGEVWFSLRNDSRLFSFDYANRVLVPHDVALESAQKYLAFDKNDRMIVATEDQKMFLYYSQKDSVSVIYEHIPTATSLYRRFRGPLVSEFSNDIIYFATEDSLNEIDLRSKRVTKLIDMPRDSYPVSMEMQPGCNTILLSLSTGLYSYNITSKEFKCILKDIFCISSVSFSDGRLWVATHDSGLMFHSPEFSRFSTISKTDDGVSLEKCNITSFSEDANGNVWISTSTMGLLLFDPREKELSHYDVHGLPSSLNVVFADSDTLWIGGSTGLYSLNLNTGSLKFESNSPTLNIIKTHSSDILIGNKFELKKKDIISGKFKPLEGFSLPPSVSQLQIAEDADGVLWIPSYSSGVFSFDLRSNETKQYIMSIESGYNGVPDMVSRVLIDHNDDIWIIGLGSNLCRLSGRDREFEQVIHNKPSGSMTMHNALEDRFNRLWLTSTEGLAMFDPKTGSTYLYSDDSGLKESSFGEACIKLNSGQMIFSSQDGLIIINPEDFPDLHPKVDIVSFVIGDYEAKTERNINEVSSLSIPYRSNSFGFSFATPGVHCPGGIVCQLLGYDKEKRYLGKSKDVFFYNVPPGEYTLEVDGHENVSVTIVPPFWASVWGILLIIFITLAVFSIAVFVILRKKQREEKAKIQENLIKEKLGFLSGFVALEQFDAKSNNAGFMKKMDEIVTSHLSDENFGVEELAKALSMSHTSLGRHMISSFGTSPVEYIKTKRLAVAYHLLRQGNISIAEISYRCGFSSPSYFTKCFKDKYGNTPTAVLKSQQNI